MPPLTVCTPARHCGKQKSACRASGGLSCRCLQSDHLADLEDRTTHLQIMFLCLALSYRSWSPREQCVTFRYHDVAQITLQRGSEEVQAVDEHPRAAAVTPG